MTVQVVEHPAITLALGHGLDLPGQAARARAGAGGRPAVGAQLPNVVRGLGHLLDGLCADYSCTPEGWSEAQAARQVLSTRVPRRHAFLLFTLPAAGMRSLDEWAAALVYWPLAGHWPDAAASEVAGLGRYVPLAGRVAALPEGWDGMLVRALAPTPQARYEALSELQQALQTPLQPRRRPGAVLWLRCLAARLQRWGRG
ncbi:hypothetical protein D3880_03270 [Pseudomonas cavernae]|uniref:Uncharacterized protein n=1 Tax=Pseudomonas cavernae TaxID=2320867 RepID=A0A385YYJ0_9PSED|nr:hypothetical protein [Pseudomonas cavernae]AYC31471.1 hypothetical protein D3880_03270 [Pseudomonas cavernae]